MDQPTQKETRAPINLRIKFRSESVEQFIERYAVDVSRGGIFIRTRDPLAVGTPLKLDFQFQNGGALMSGDGTVVWIREVDPNRASVPPGMGVRFDKLTPESQAVLEQLLIEKAKRERGGVPGSGGAQGGGGMAVRRPSSMFSVLEPQASADGAAAGKAQVAAPGMGPIATPLGTPAASPGPTPATAPITAPVMASVTAPAVGSKAAPGPAPTAAPVSPATTAAPSAAASLYRPLGTARNPFSGIAGGAVTAPSPTPPSASPGLAKPGEPRTATQAGTGNATDDADDGAASFDENSDEPTQIAGRLPSFLTSDEEETTVVPSPSLAVAREGTKQAPGVASSEGPRTTAPEPRRLPGSVGAKTPLPERKTGGLPATLAAAEFPRKKQSLDQAPPADQAQDAAIRDTAKSATTVAGARGDQPADRSTGRTPLPVVSAGTAPLGASPAAAASAQAAPVATASVSVSVPPGAAEVSETRPASTAAPAPGSVTAATTLTAPSRVTAPATKMAASVSTPPAPSQAAKGPARPDKKRSAAAMVGLTVVVLGAASIFLFRYFGSHATQPVAITPAPTAAVAPGGPATVTGDPVAPAPGSGSAIPAPTSAPSGASAEPSGSGATAAPTAVPVAEPAAPPEPAVAPPVAPAAKAPTEAAPAAEVKPSEAQASGPRGGKTKTPRGPKDTGPTPIVAASPGAAAKPAEPAPATTTATSPEAPAAEAEATAHQIRITSKPAGADVTLDGQTIGKTPYSIGIADVSAPHFIAVRKDGFEPFEQMISASSTWAKTKVGKGKAALLVLKINAKLKPLPGAAGAASTGGDAKPATEPPSPNGDPAAKVEVVRPDRPLPPSDSPPAESPP